MRLPCSICDKNFGGHETAAFLDSDYFNGFGVCPCCVEEAHRRNKQLMNELEREGTLVVNQDGVTEYKLFSEIYRKI